MKAVLFFTSCIAASLAAPTSWTPEMGALYSEMSLNVLKARSNGNGQALPKTCDLSKLNITQYLATIPDAPPVSDPGSAKLVLVTIGRGIQNYTCEDNKATTKPKAIGAVANLYDVSCVASKFPDLLTLISPFAVQYNASLKSDGKLMAFNVARAGHHFFNAAGSPVFDLNDNKDNQLGVLIGNGKTPEMKVDAPVSAVKGQVRATNGNTGAVPWLHLNAVNGSTNGLSDVYRVDTAGGAAPSTCGGQPSLISVEYAAQYWFYTSS